MHEGVVKEDDFRLPEICVKKHNKNTPKEKELIDSVSTGKINKVKIKNIYEYYFRCIFKI